MQFIKKKEKKNGWNVFDHSRDETICWIRFYFEEIIFISIRKIENSLNWYDHSII